MTTTEPRYFVLPPTKTYVRRRVGWFPGDTGDGRVGTLRIVLDRSKRGGDSTEWDEYGVQPEADTPEGARSFLLLNDTDPGQKDVYRCTLTRLGAGCTCTAGNCRLPCKHADALLRLAAEGLL